MKTIAIDFDGVISHYTGWKGELSFEPPVAGAKEALAGLRKRGWVIIIFTTRSDLNDVEKYLDEHQLTFDYINENPFRDKENTNSQKVVADIYLDDKAVRFNGNWEAALCQIKACYKKEWWRA